MKTQLIAKIAASSFTLLISTAAIALPIDRDIKLFDHRHSPRYQAVYYRSYIQPYSAKRRNIACYNIESYGAPIVRTFTFIVVPLSRRAHA
jgi:hypothetical protein